MVENRSILVLYTTAVCNLKCVYCYIDKNPALLKIDNILDESFKGDYYFDFAKQMFPDKHQLKEVQIWGGEPTLRLDRAYHTVDRLISHYPELNSFMMSTNFTGSNWFEQYYGFLQILGKYPNRTFTFRLQLSLDGPPAVTDSQRGVGVTKIFTEHFQEFLATVEDACPSNVNINFFFKPTLTAEIFSKLQTKETVLEYFRFFELYYDAYHAKIKNKQQFYMGYSVPNTACPSPHTKEEGILFANYSKICRELTNEQRSGIKHFKYYDNIISFMPRQNGKVNYENLNYCNGCGNCGSGHFVVGLLPYNMLSACHNGFTDLLSEYKKECMNTDDKIHSIDFKLFMNDSHIMIHTPETFHKYELMIREFYNPRSKFKLANMASTVRMLACSGQIDEKYCDADEALKGAYFVEQSTSYCVRDNIGSTGSLILPPVGLFKLLLNGAREYIEDEK